VLAHYITEAAAEQTGIGTWRYAPATQTRWVASINQVHTAAGLDAPGRSEVVRRALSGIRRIRATPPNRRAPLLLADIRTLMISIGETAGGWPAGVAARRDMALLLMGFAGAHRRSGALGARAMSGDAIAEMIQRRAAVAGFTPAQVEKLGGHSLRAGFVTEAFRQGADAHSIMRQTGHRSPVMLEVYAREHAPLVGNAVTRIGL